MTREQIFNFSAGPSAMPESVLKKAGEEILNYRGSGLSVMEMSHRGSVFQEIFDSAREKLRRAMNIPDSHEILFLQGGATLQFAAIAMNLMDGGGADYALTGNFSAKAAKEAAKYGPVNTAFDGAAEGYRRIPRQEELKLSPGARYFHYCGNNTAYGTSWGYVPESGAPLVCDMSSEILSKPVDVGRFGLIYAGAQKNMAPAGLTVLILRRELAGRELPITPQVMSYRELLSSGSMLNTPPCWCIYMLGLMLDWLEAQGGVEAMAALKAERAGLVYDFLDNSTLFRAGAEPGSRSDMNIVFSTGGKELDAQFVKGAEKRGLLSLKGHKAAGGLRASLYNAMPIEGARALVNYMKEFERETHV